MMSKVNLLLFSFVIETYHAAQTEPDIVPLQSLGVVDVAGNGVEENEVLSHAFANVSLSDRAEGWAIKRSSDFVNEYPRRTTDGSLSAGTPDDPNHLLGSFPYLFPYGLGGFEVDRPNPVSYEAHSRWALRYSDKRFREDHFFMFQIFGVLQKRQICAAATLQISQRSFLRYERAIRTLKPSDLEQAGAEERAHLPLSNGAIRSFRHTLSAVRSKVMGTDESRIKIRSLIWGMCMMKNPPSIWLTINPADTQDPIAQVLSGQDIDLDHFAKLDERPSEAAITSDPYASASFFHFMINAILRELLGIRGYKRGQSIQREKGVLGIIEAYTGTVEAQGRGTLHLHMVLWLRGSMPSDKMKELLLTEEFRTKVKSFIAANIRADLPNNQGTSVLTIPRESHVSFSRPLDPRSSQYEDNQDGVERRLARTVQVHQCGQGCMKFVRGQFTCKRGAPFPLAGDDWIEADGTWGPKRTYGYFNNWCPAILQCLRANHDIKLITNGIETKDIAWYITHYVAKKQRDSSNTSALLAKTFAYHHRSEHRNFDIVARNKKLIQRCANTLSCEQELSAPEVVSYLMGWGDRYISHHFETIPWFSVLSLLRKTFPVLNQSR